MALSSTYEVESHAQADGRAWVRESHVDSAGAEHVITYLASPGTDYDSELSAHAAHLAESLGQQERESVAQQLLAGIDPFPAGGADFEWSTRLQMLGYLIGELLSRPAIEVIRAAPFVAQITDDELTALGMNAAAISALRAKASALAGLLPTLTSEAMPSGG